MDMSKKTKLLVVWLLLVVASTFLFSQFWSYTVFVLQKAVVTDILPLPFLTKVAAGIGGVHLLS
jgi:hypothetical protein